MSIPDSLRNVQKYLFHYGTPIVGAELNCNEVRQWKLI